MPEGRKEPARDPVVRLCLPGERQEFWEIPAELQGRGREEISCLEAGHTLWIEPRSTQSRPPARPPRKGGRRAGSRERGRSRRGGGPRRISSSAPGRPRAGAPGAGRRGACCSLSFGVSLQSRNLRQRRRAAVRARSRCRHCPCPKATWPSPAGTQTDTAWSSSGRAEGEALQGEKAEPQTRSAVRLGSS